jgi:hypothetical protein
MQCGRVAVFTDWSDSIYEFRLLELIAATEAEANFRIEFRCMHGWEYYNLMEDELDFLQRQGVEPEERRFEVAERAVQTALDALEPVVLVDGMGRDTVPEAVWDDLLRALIREADLRAAFAAWELKTRAPAPG